MSMQRGPNNMGNDNPNQEQGSVSGRKILKAARKLGNNAGASVVKGATAVINHPTTGDVAIGALGASVLGAAALVTGVGPAAGMAWLSTQAYFLGLAAAAGGTVPVAGRVVKNATNLAMQGIVSGYSRAKNLLIRAPQAEARVEESDSSESHDDDLENDHVRNQVLAPTQSAPLVLEATRQQLLKRGRDTVEEEGTRQHAKRAKASTATTSTANDDVEVFAQQARRSTRHK